MKKMIVFVLLIGLVLTGCSERGAVSGSDENSTDENTTPVVSSKVNSPQEAAAFLSRATFGATQEEIDNLVGIGDYRKWIEAEFRKEPSYHTAWVEAHARGVDGTPDLRDSDEDWRKHSDALGEMQRDAWWDIAVHGNDQLRQRVAFALSEIFVISKNGPLTDYPDARLSYYDVLVKDAFADFETLLKDITYHPAMGKYLSYLGNAKADPAVGSHPDENYAREVMQLFTIGLYELNIDGSFKRNAQGKRMATYTQADIREMAKVFTGLSDDNDEFDAQQALESHHAKISPMVAFEQYHDTSEKKILHAEKIIPAGGDTRTDINTALHILCTHPNTAPFISKQLIQRLVTSNPTSAYVERVAKVFAKTQGNLKEVIKAVLLDDEALHGAQKQPDIFGKLREPVLYVTHLWRAFDARNSYHTLKEGDQNLYRYASFYYHETKLMKQENALEALTVFNYFAPDDAPAKLQEQNLTAPELELYGKEGIDDVLMGLITKSSYVYGLFDITADLQIAEEKDLIHARKYDVLLDRLDLVLTGGNLSSQSRKAIKGYMEAHASLDDEKLARLVIGLVMTSPDYALQR